MKDENNRILTPKRVVLFDLDGTLLDSAALVRASTRHALREVLDRTATDEEIAPYFGQLLEDQFRGLAPDVGEATIAELVRSYRAHNEIYHDQLVTPCPGAVDAVQALARHGLGLAVVTSKRASMATRGLVVLGLHAYFKTVVSLESTLRHKPFPDPLWEAMKAFPNVSREESMMVGDSPYDMGAAKAAGVTGVGIAGEGFSQDVLREAGAFAVLPSLEGLWDWYAQGVSLKGAADGP